MNTLSKSEPAASTPAHARRHRHSSRTEDSSRKNDVFIPSKISRLSALARNDAATEDMQRVGKFLRAGSLATVIMWLSLLALVWWIAPTDSYERLNRAEHNACVMVVVLLVVSNCSRLVPLLIRDKTQFIKTGAMVSSCTVQFIAVASVGIMILFPTPILLDPITGQRVHLVRWAEWTPLSFLMTFLTEGIDMPLHSIDYKRLAWTHAFAIGLSTSAGLIFPFCKTLKVWMIVFVVSCVLFCSLYIRLYQRYKRFQATKRGTTVDEQEHYDRVRLSLRLLQACAIMWTLLVIGFCLCCIAEELVLLSEAGSKLRSLWASPALPLITENIFEVGSKIWYLILVVDVHELVFDEGGRAVRRLEEMRDIMSVVWESSSDVILLCVKSEHSIIAVVSPTFLKLYNGGEQQDDENIALVLEIIPNASKHDKSIPKHRVMELDMSSPVTLERVKQSNYLKSAEFRMSAKKNIESLAKLVITAWDCSSEKDTLLMHELHGHSVDNDERAIKCEAKINILDANSLVIVLRDISERFQRFEAEKQLVVEMTERKKDAEANRFTRHEVKNGLLAAIGLVDTVRESFVSHGNEVTASSAFSEYMASRRRRVPQFSGESSSSQSSIVRNTSELSLASSEGGSDEGDRHPRSSGAVARSMAELDYTLREILDTVLSEAMARDVVHEVFEPRKERIDVVSVLNGPREAILSSSERFPILAVPSPFPQLHLDPQILRYIHRNAVSNAVKYGQEGGQVTTEISYDNDKQEFEMKVINLPGDRHERLFMLDAEAVNSVFAAGTRLHETLESSFSSLDEALVTSSAGDGAWIMQKCARTLGGECRIEFQANKTVFSMNCPATACYPKQNKDVKDLKGKTFRLPENTWGIAIDDSGIQRKLLTRFLSLAGVEKSKRRVMGKDAEEVLGFNDFLEETIRENPNDNFLVIVDENLDILEGGAHQKTVSGSSLVKLLRERLNPNDEKRMLALVRSANDSAEDVALYKSRAHGFLPKAPLQKDRILELIQPWWLERFPSDTLTCGPLIEEDDPEGFHVSSADLMKSVEVVDALLLGDEASLAARWPAIREKIHALKGDIKTMKRNARVTTILEALEKLRGNALPDELVERWRLIRSLIVSIL